MSADDIPDLLTNLAACSANQPSLHDEVQTLVKSTTMDSKSIQAYEYHFNLSQTLLKTKDFPGCLDSMLFSRELLYKEGESTVEQDMARMKT